MTTRARVALATCVEFSEYDEDAADLLAALAGTDVEVASVPWDDATADWMPAGVGDLPGVYRETAITARVSDPAQLAVAEQALAAVPGGPADLLYARVDLLPGPAGSPLLLELELTEPSLYLVHSSGAADRLAGAIAAAATAAYGP